MGRRGKNFSAIELELLWRRWKGGESSLQNRWGTRLVEVGDLASDSATWRAGDATTAARGAGPESPRARGDFARRGNGGRGTESGAPLGPCALDDQSRDSAAWRTDTLSREWRRSSRRASARRPTRCRLAVERRLQRVVEQRLIAAWSSEQIAAWLVSTYPEEPARAAYAQVWKATDAESKSRDKLRAR